MKNGICEKYHFLAYGMGSTGIRPKTASTILLPSVKITGVDSKREKCTWMYHREMDSDPNVLCLKPAIPPDFQYNS